MLNNKFYLVVLDHSNEVFTQIYMFTLHKDSHEPNAKHKFHLYHKHVEFTKGHPSPFLKFITQGAEAAAKSPHL